MLSPPSLRAARIHVVDHRWVGRACSSAVLRLRCRGSCKVDKSIVVMAIEDVWRLTYRTMLPATETWFDDPTALR